MALSETQKAAAMLVAWEMAKQTVDPMQSKAYSALLELFETYYLLVSETVYQADEDMDRGHEALSQAP